MRNAVGLDFDPKTGHLWTNDNQVDGMGDDQPPGELNHINVAAWYSSLKVTVTMAQ
ncbi:hypothetical protein ACFPL7_24010 [Dongia soli]|uniref:Uncharacterized protein n=1 Tax=Dongia soli TaxID=600628 RepID=A0ABU5EHM1_9PROT|nr:hypothetical protein [Dongia soli]MDY0885369.1 hypothetical protein [Dongia soli]